jgi:hypothetical protein
VAAGVIVTVNVTLSASVELATRKPEATLPATGVASGTTAKEAGMDEMAVTTSPGWRVVGLLSTSVTATAYETFCAS